MRNWSLITHYCFFLDFPLFIFETTILKNLMKKTTFVDDILSPYEVLHLN